MPDEFIAHNVLIRLSDIQLILIAMKECDGNYSNMLRRLDEDLAFWSFNTKALHHTSESSFRDYKAWMKNGGPAVDPTSRYVQKDFMYIDRSVNGSSRALQVYKLGEAVFTYQDQGKGSNAWSVHVGQNEMKFALSRYEKLDQTEQMFPLLPDQSDSARTNVGFSLSTEQPMDPIIIKYRSVFIRLALRLPVSQKTLQELGLQTTLSIEPSRPVKSNDATPTNTSRFGQIVPSTMNIDFAMKVLPQTLQNELTELYPTLEHHLQKTLLHLMCDELQQDLSVAELGELAEQVNLTYVLEKIFMHKDCTDLIRIAILNKTSVPPICLFLAKLSPNPELCLAKPLPLEAWLRQSTMYIRYNDVYLTYDYLVRHAMQPGNMATQLFDDVIHFPNLGYEPTKVTSASSTFNLGIN